MTFGICNLGIVAVRKEPSHQSEMVNQLLFGEHFTITESDKNWSKIKIAFDNYEGYINNLQFSKIPESLFNELSTNDLIFSGEIIDFITNNNQDLLTIPLGSRLPFYSNKTFSINEQSFDYDGKILQGKLSKSEIIHKAFAYLNTPYLWGGKTPFGIDCSGFTQMVYKLCGYQLFRDAKTQATQGDVLSFIEESEPGDLAFFDNDEGEIVHVGIILKDYNIIHAHGKVRIDTLDHSGIFNAELQTHTHKLRIIKRII